MDGIEDKGISEECHAHHERRSLVASRNKAYFVVRPPVKTRERETTTVKNSIKGKSVVIGRFLE